MLAWEILRRAYVNKGYWGEQREAVGDCKNEPEIDDGAANAHSLYCGLNFDAEENMSNMGGKEDNRCAEDQNVNT